MEKILRVNMSDLTATFEQAPERYKNLGGRGLTSTIVADEVFGPKDTSVMAQLTKIRGTDAQAIIGWTIAPPQVIMLKNWKQLGMDKKFRFYQSHGFGSKRNIELAGGAAEGVYAPLGRVVMAEVLPKWSAQREFALKYKTDYEKKFGKGVSTFGGQRNPGNISEAHRRTII